MLGEVTVVEESEDRPDLEVFSTLPPSKSNRRGFDWAWIADQVRANAPNWCEIGEFNTSVATHIRRGRYPTVPPAEFEVATRRAEKRGRARLFLRVKQ